MRQRTGDFATRVVGCKEVVLRVVASAVAYVGSALICVSHSCSWLWSGLWSQARLCGDLHVALTLVLESAPRPKVSSGDREIT